MKYFKSFLLFNFVLFALTTFFTQAYALSITPGDAWKFGDDTSQDDINAKLTEWGVENVLYKSNYVEGAEDIEENALADSYDTTYTSSEDAPSGGTITYIGGSFISYDPYLLVKDGNHAPAWYLFDLTDRGLNWDGKEDLVLSGFWTGKGAISHVSLYGGDPLAPVPEPSTVILLGFGLAGFAGIRRKRPDWISWTIS